MYRPQHSATGATCGTRPAQAVPGHWGVHYYYEFQGACTAELLSEVVADCSFILPVTECVNGCNAYRHPVILRRPSQGNRPFPVAFSNGYFRFPGKRTAVLRNLFRSFLWVGSSVFCNDFVNPLLFFFHCFRFGLFPCFTLL